MIKKNSIFVITGVFLFVFVLAAVFAGSGKNLIRENADQPETKTRERKIVEDFKRVKTEEFKDCQELNRQWLKSQKPIYLLESEELNSILKELQQRFPNKQERLMALALLRLDTPYQLGSLGEEGRLDNGPIFRLDVADCTAFVLTTTALLCSDTVDEARGLMEFLNYRSEEITFENRLHFTTDRNSVSPYFQDITREVIEAEKIKQKEVVLNKIKDDGQRLININWQKPIILNYVSTRHITSEFLQGLPSAVGIAFIRENDAAAGLDIAHEGFLFNGKDFIHAVSGRGRVVKEDFFDYYFIGQNTSRFEGIILFEVGL